jgi:hypothetical protein
MTQDEYLSTRVDEQIEWLSRSSQSNQHRFKRLRLMELCLATGIPVLAAYVDVHAGIRLAVAVAGALVAIIAGALALWKPQELWVQYRATAEALKREKMLLLTGSPPYNAEQAFATFVVRVETLLGSENSAWAVQMRSQQTASAAGASLPAAAGG